MFAKYFWLSLLAGLAYFLYSHDFTEEIKTYFTDGPFNAIYFGSNQNTDEHQRVFTKNELKRYTNLQNGLYLSILGQVYDVSKGAKYYGPGGNYHALTGRDASLAFVTGEFDGPGLTDDISSLSVQQIKALDDWVQFYNEKYIYKGRLYGRYYERDGSPTTESRKVEEKVLIAKQETFVEEKWKSIFPPCNVEWKPDSGTAYWCSKKSGGIDRDWIGVPRIFFETVSARSSRCACVNLDSEEYREYKHTLKEYNDCAEYATRCFVNTNTT